MKNLIYLAFLILSIIAFSCKPSSKEPVKSNPDSLVSKNNSEMEKMITAKIFVKKERIDDFIKLAKTMIDSTLKEAGCESYMLYQNPYETGKLIFVETYKNQAAIDAHFASSYFKNFGPKIKDWLTADSEVKIYNISGAK